MMTQHKDPIPENASREELAAFWDTHDFTDYWDELKPVKVEPLPRLEQGITVKFDRRTLDQLRLRAGNIGTKPTTLIRIWVKERLRQQ